MLLPLFVAFVLCWIGSALLLDAWFRRARTRRFLPERPPTVGAPLN